MFGGEKKPHSNQQQSERNDRGNINNRTPRSHKPQDTPAVANFKQRLRNRAHNKLEQNKEQVYSLSAAYNSEDPKSKPLFDELRAVVTQDGELEAKQNQLQRQIGRIEANAQLAGAGQAPFPEDYEQLNPLKDQLEQIKQVRATLLANYPISGLIKTHQVGDDVSDAELDEILNNRLAGVLFDIDTAKERISNGDVPLHQLDAVIPEIIAQTPEHQRAEVEQYLKKQQRIDTTIEVGGTLGEIGLTVGAIVSGILSGGVIPTILGGLGTALGIGNAVYQFEKADDLNLIAKTGNAGGNQLLTQPDKAKQDYLLGWANLVLAGIDGGLAIKEGVSLLKGAKAAEQILAGGGADVIAKLKPEQIQRFNTLVTAPDDVQAQKIYQSLQQELGQDFDTAYSLFARANQQVGGKTEYLRDDLWDMEFDQMFRRGDFEYYPELKPLYELAERNRSQTKKLLPVELEKIRLNLLRNTQDLDNIYDVMRKAGLRVSREDIAAVKQYNFNSPGIYFSPENYMAWKKLAQGRGKIDDARYLLHEIEEVKQLRKIQEETGFDFMGKDFFKMDRDGRDGWELEFYDKANKTGHYLKAHSKALEHEYKFMSRQIAKITNGEVNLNSKNDYLKLILSELDENLKEDHVENILVHGRTLEDQIKDEIPEYVELAELAKQPVQLSAHLKKKLNLREPVTLGDLLDKARQKSLKDLKPGI